MQKILKARLLGERNMKALVPDRRRRGERVGGVDRSRQVRHRAWRSSTAAGWSRCTSSTPRRCSELLISKIFVEDESFEYEKSLEENGQRYLNYVEELARKKGVAVEKVLRKGAVFSEIINAAEEREADLILIGGFEEKGGTRDVLSRQHREIVRNSKCSILVVKEPDVEFLYRKA